MSYTPINIFDHTDYIEFLNAWFNQERAQKKSFSFQFFANKAGFKSRSYMQFVLKGKRPLTLKSLPKVTDALGLNKKQSQYFEAMVVFKENQDHQIRMRYWEIMQKLGKSSKINQLQWRKFEYFKEWYIAPLREVVCQVDFKGDFAYLGRLLLPAISSKQARDGVEVLLKLNLIKKQGSIFKAGDQHIKASELVKSLAIRHFQKQGSELAKSVYERIPREDRDLSTITLSTDLSGFEKIKTLAQEFRKDVIRIVEESKEVDRVYQLNLQLFPLSKNLN